MKIDERYTLLEIKIPPQADVLITQYQLECTIATPLFLIFVYVGNRRGKTTA